MARGVSARGLGRDRSRSKRAAFQAPGPHDLGAHRARGDQECQGGDQVFDFEPVARKNVPPAHFGYMASGIDDEVTLRANREGFLKFQLRPRRLNDVSKVDMSVELFGTKYSSPIFLAPTGGNQFFHPDGEVAVAKAGRAGDHLYILSTSGNAAVEEVSGARGAPVWFQLYASPRWEVAAALIRRAEAAGCPVLAVTIDRVGGRNQETFFRLAREDTRDCSGCAAASPNARCAGTITTASI
jgi:4-hydroxymandelate oxidase